MMLKSNLFLVFSIFCCLIILISSIDSVKCQEEDAEEVEEVQPEKTCTQVVFGLIRGFLGSIGKCLGGKFKIKSPFEIVTRFYCLIKCILQDQGLLNEEGKLDEVAALFYFQENIPEIIRDVVINDAQPCLELAAKFSDEYYCQSYAPFVQCVFTSLLRTFTPYALDCFTTPGLGFFFSFINLIVPRFTPSASSPEALEIRRRLAAKKGIHKRKQITAGNNSTLIYTTTKIPPTVKISS